MYAQVLELVAAENVGSEISVLIGSGAANLSGVGLAVDLHVGILKRVGVGLEVVGGLYVTFDFETVFEESSNHGFHLGRELVDAEPFEQFFLSTEAEGSDEKGEYEEKVFHG